MRITSVDMWAYVSKCWKTVMRSILGIHFRKNNFLTRFALPIYDNEQKTENYNVYSARLVVNVNAKGIKYLYDVVDIKKEASNPLKIHQETSGKKPLPQAW